ncbi:peroxidase [Streptomyces sp. NPDC023327]|uniref:Dyp-type peroxidase n=1 Tax=Streptomyces sp. NPDC023327 TaxID=3157088 RepID=UPI0033F8A17E
MADANAGGGSPATLELDDIQGYVVHHPPLPYFGTHATLRIDDPAQGRELLRRLARHIVPASRWHDADVDVWMGLGLTYAGLKALHLSADTLASFPEAFRQGMAARAESKLGDTGPSAPAHWEEPFGTGQIHVTVTMYVADQTTRRQRLEEGLRQLHEELPGITLLGRGDFAQPPNGRTHLGYVDGISQPNIQGSGIRSLPGQGPPIAAGEFVLGYPAKAGTPLPMPHPHVLGRNSTYACFRKQHIDVAAFRRFLTNNADSEHERDLLAAKMMGRWPSGAPLVLTPQADNPALARDRQRNNDFDYSTDPRGRACPLGAHIRRVNPRNACLEVLTDVDIHRLIRRGTVYGPPLPKGVCEDDGADRGIYSIFLSARAPDTFEFVKKEWVEDGNFLSLDEEKDPVAGDNHDGTFTIPRHPFPKKLEGLTRFTRTLGGEYCFVPSLPALTWLANA